MLPVLTLPPPPPCTPQALEAEVSAACSALSLRSPLPVSAEGRGGRGDDVALVFRNVMHAAMQPDLHIPDTPARKVGGGRQAPT